MCCVHNVRAVYLSNTPRRRSSAPNSTVVGRIVQFASAIKIKPMAYVPTHDAVHLKSLCAGARVRRRRHTATHWNEMFASCSRVCVCWKRKINTTQSPMFACATCRVFFLLLLGSNEVLWTRQLFKKWIIYTHTQIHAHSLREWAPYVHGNYKSCPYLSVCWIWCGRLPRCRLRCRRRRRPPKPSN